MMKTNFAFESDYDAETTRDMKLARRAGGTTWAWTQVSVRGAGIPCVYLRVSAESYRVRR